MPRTTSSDCGRESPWRGRDEYTVSVPPPPPPSDAPPPPPDSSSSPHAATPKARMASRQVHTTSQRCFKKPLLIGWSFRRGILNRPEASLQRKGTLGDTTSLQSPRIAVPPCVGAAHPRVRHRGPTHLIRADRLPRRYL